MHTLVATLALCLSQVANSNARIVPLLSDITEGDGLSGDELSVDMLKRNSETTCYEDNTFKYVKHMEDGAAFCQHFLNYPTHTVMTRFTPRSTYTHTIKTKSLKTTGVTTYTPVQTDTATVTTTLVERDIRGQITPGVTPRDLNVGVLAGLGLQMDQNGSQRAASLFSALVSACSCQNYPNPTVTHTSTASLKVVTLEAFVEEVVNVDRTVVASTSYTTTTVTETKSTITNSSPFSGLTPTSGSSSARVTTPSELSLPVSYTSTTFSFSESVAPRSGQAVASSSAPLYISAWPSEVGGWSPGPFSWHRSSEAASFSNSGLPRTGTYSSVPGSSSISIKSEQTTHSTTTKSEIQTTASTTTETVTSSSAPLTLSRVATTETKSKSEPISSPTSVSSFSNSGLPRTIASSSAPISSSVPTTYSYSWTHTTKHRQPSVITKTVTVTQGQNTNTSSTSPSSSLAGNSKSTSISISSTAHRNSTSTTGSSVASSTAHSNSTSSQIAASSASVTASRSSTTPSSVPRFSNSGQPRSGVPSSSVPAFSSGQTTRTRPTTAASSHPSGRSTSSSRFSGTGSSKTPSGTGTSSPVGPRTSSPITSRNVTATSTRTSISSMAVTNSTRSAISSSVPPFSNSGKPRSRVPSSSIPATGHTTRPRPTSSGVPTASSCPGGTFTTTKTEVSTTTRSTTTTKTEVSTTTRFATTTMWGCWDDCPAEPTGGRDHDHGYGHGYGHGHGGWW